MFVRKMLEPPRLAIIVAVFLGCASTCRAGIVTFEIQVDTTQTPGLAGTTGALDFQFNPGFGAPYGSASVYGFTTDGTLNPGTVTSGDGSGDLDSGPLALNNGQPGDAKPVNEVEQTSFTFGSFFDVFVELNVPTPGVGDSTSTFYLSIYDQGGNAVQSTGFDGDAALAITPNAGGGYDVDSGAGVTASVTPEPSSLVLVTLGGIGLAGYRRLSRRTQREIARAVV